MNSRLRLLSYNIQVGIGTNRYHEYLTHSWKHFLPHRNQEETLGRIASLVREFDIVGLQEVDGGSLRSRFINQTEYLAARGGFPHWYSQTNRRLVKLAHHSLGILARTAFDEVKEIRLAGPIPGRGATMVRLGGEATPLVIVIAHLALGKRTRVRQIEQIARLIRDYQHVIVMGDLNCTAHSHEFAILLRLGGLREALPATNTYPSWRPIRHIDHVLVSSTIRVVDADVLNHRYSDHLPIALELEVPLALPGLDRAPGNRGSKRRDGVQPTASVV